MGKQVQYLFMFFVIILVFCDLLYTYTGSKTPGLETFGLRRISYDANIELLNSSLKPFINSRGKDMGTAFTKISTIIVNETHYTVAVNEKPLLKYMVAGSTTFLYSYSAERYENIGFGPFLKASPVFPHTIFSFFKRHKYRYLNVSSLKFQYVFGKSLYFRRLANGSIRTWKYKHTIIVSSPCPTYKWNEEISPGISITHEARYCLVGGEYVGSIPLSVSVLIPTSYADKDVLRELGIPSTIVGNASYIHISSILDSSLMSMLEAKASIPIITPSYAIWVIIPALIISIILWTIIMFRKG